MAVQLLQLRWLLLLHRPVVDDVAGRLQLLLQLLQLGCVHCTTD
jgi:hypothetical protein